MDKKQRAPIVTVLGHVDHGKTTLLDAIRKTNVTAKEAGGITQGIGASSVTSKDGKIITFIDTPGHAAFSKMRSRGAKVADIAILVVDASDGVKPQTKEALEAIKKAEIPFIVAITKIDLPSASPDTVIGQLEKEGVSFEGRGGQTPKVDVSAKTGKGLEDLLEVISLVAEVHGVKGTLTDPLSAVVIETSKDRRGPVASVVVRSGKISVGDIVFVEDQEDKIRGLFDSKGSSVKEVEAGQAVQILGFRQLPQVGTEIASQIKPSGVEKTPPTKLGKIEKDKIAVVLKAKNAGALEAILAILPEQVIVTSSGTGDVNESDVLGAKALNALIFAFETGIPTGVKKLAETEGVKIEKFEIIYELTDRINEIIKKGEITILGKAQIQAIFPFNSKKVAGCKVLEGRISKGDNLVLTREDKEIGKIKAVSMKKQKQEISVAQTSEEFGLLFEPQLDFTIGDVIISVAK